MRHRHRWKERWFMRPFRLVLDHPAYWSLNRRSVTRAFALGLFIAFIPVPVHLILGASVALLLRLNVPAAIAGTFLANPVTMVPMYISGYWLGCHILGVHPRPIAFDLSWDWLTTALLPVWKPFMLGCVLLGAFAAVCGYVIVGGVWHLSLVLKYHKRRGPGASPKSTNEPE
jgi:uncharacterized protein (DUF2062 family)